MRETRRFFFLVFICIGLTVSAFAQRSFFSAVNENTILAAKASRVIIPQRYNTFRLSDTEIKEFFKTIPSQSQLQNRVAAPIIELPMPDGTMARFQVWESPVMEPGLAAKYPEIKTYAGQGIDDPYATVRFDYNPYFGFSAQILSIKGNVYIDPYSRGDVSYNISYYSRDYKKDDFFACLTGAGLNSDQVLWQGNKRAHAAALSYIHSDWQWPARVNMLLQRPDWQLQL